MVYLSNNANSVLLHGIPLKELSKNPKLRKLIPDIWKFAVGKELHKRYVSFLINLEGVISPVRAVAISVGFFKDDQSLEKLSKIYKDIFFYTKRERVGYLNGKSVTRIIPKTKKIQRKKYG